MKTRQGFVSNSSSSSFIIVGCKPKTCNSILLTTEQAKKVVEYIRQGEGWNGPQNVTWTPFNTTYLTEFLSDAGELLGEISNLANSYEYTDGNHGGPYNEEAYVCLHDEPWASIWILKEHYVKPSIEEEDNISDARPVKSKSRMEDLIL